ncbi:MAG: NAD(P)H-hydrate dehydratase [Bacteroidetes bacterium]|nr:MAG: NAD(P)H-hydrate dehydratase [Bacteroidota bacterium]
MKVFSTEQIRNWDQFTITHEPIESLALMNRAAGVFTDWFVTLYPDTERPVCIFAGTGNNGGDGVAVARMLHQLFYRVKVFVCDFSGKHSADFDAQISALPPNRAVSVQVLRTGDPFPEIDADAVLIDALFGSGLSRPLTGIWAEWIGMLNSLSNEKVAIDLPSGLFADKYSPGPFLRAHRTLTFEAPKLAFFFPESVIATGVWEAVSIGLHPDYAEQTESPYRYLTHEDARSLYRPRQKFSHKGTYGHALLINGSKGKMGAAVLAAGACLRSGAGLLTLHTPQCGYPILQTTVPEAMCSLDTSEEEWTQLPDLHTYTAIGVGCGIGQSPKTAQALKRLLQKASAPLILDADALNLLAAHPNWWQFVPEGSILTPHPKEFERLFGKSTDAFSRNTLQRTKAQEHRIYIVLKGAHTAIAAPDGSCWFNSSGNPGMATGGSGDVLTGLLTGLRAQGYTPLETCLLGVYMHGLAGDLAATELSEPGLTSGDLTAWLGEAWLAIGQSWE